MRKILIATFVLSSFFLVADEHTGEWEYGEVIDKMTGEVTSQQIKVTI